MTLLKESKRAWLLPYILCTGIVVLLYCFLRESVIAKTIYIMLFNVQILMLIAFLIILLLKREYHCRIIISLIFLIVTVCEGVAGFLDRWYIIIPLFLLSEIYMAWVLGGVLNCVIAGLYKSRISENIACGRNLFKQYSEELVYYNNTNKTGVSEIRRNKEPDWSGMTFNLSSIEMFELENAICGISNYISKWNKNIDKLDEINRRLCEKHNAMTTDRELLAEEETLEQVVSKQKVLGKNMENMDKQIGKLEKIRKKNTKKERKILRRGLRRFL